MSLTESDLARAYALLQQGNPRAAEAACRETLARSGNDADVLHLLGLIRKDAGDLAEGERLLRASIAIEPRQADFRANLGNLLRRLGRLHEAKSSYRDAVRLNPEHRSARIGLARTLNDLGEHTAAQAECRFLLTKHGTDAHVWSALAMTLRDQRRLPEAEAAYRQAIAVNSNYGPAYHNLGALYAQMERAEEALAALARARGLGVSGFELEFNRGRALMQLYRIDEAEQAFAQAVALNPRHAQAQLNLARLRYMRGEPDFARDVAAAAAAHDDDLGLHKLRVALLRRSGDLRSAEHVLRDLLNRKGPLPEIRTALAGVLYEAGELREAEIHALEAAAAKPNDAITVETLVGIMLGRGRPEDALPFISAQRSRQPYMQSWIAYEATAARLMGHPRYRELYDYDRLLRCYELEPPAGWSSMDELNAALVQALDARHQFVTHPLDQSLRNGSQTARSLVMDPDPAIQAILAAFEGPIESYRRTLGADPAHPLSARNRGATRMAGAWSIQLRREGFHVNHIHPEGWISSAYYVAVPTEVSDEALMSGWIKFGETRFPVAGAGPERFVQPRPGRLLLFPSYMWHGTNPIHGPEPRTTIAFDAVPAEVG